MQLRRKLETDVAVELADVAQKRKQRRSLLGSATATPVPVPVMGKKAGAEPRPPGAAPKRNPKNQVQQVSESSSSRTRMEFAKNQIQQETATRKRIMLETAYDAECKEVEKLKKSVDEVQKKLEEDRRRVQMGEKILAADTAELEERGSCLARLRDDWEEAEQVEAHFRKQVVFWNGQLETSGDQEGCGQEDCEQEDGEQEYAEDGGVEPDSGADQRYENIFLALGIVCDMFCRYVNRHLNLHMLFFHQAGIVILLMIPLESSAK